MPISAVLILLDLLLITSKTCNACEKSPGKCCFNFYSEGNSSCTECPAGTFGLNCGETCLRGFYGRLCRLTCSCPSHICDPVSGCVEDRSVNSATEPSYYSGDAITEETLTESVWQNISFALIGSIVTIVAAVGVVYLFSRTKRVPVSGDLKDTGEIISTDNDQSQQPEWSANDVPLQKMNTDNDGNVYDDIRSSKMIAFHSCVLPLEHCLPSYTEENETSIINKQNHDYKHLSSRQTCENNTQNKIFKKVQQTAECGELAENCQYSVLSLRRNFNPSEVESYALKQPLHRQYSQSNNDQYCLMNAVSGDDPKWMDSELDLDIAVTSSCYSTVSNKH